MNARPALWWHYASLLLINGHTIGVEEKLLAAEAAVGTATGGDQPHPLVGHIAAARAVLALTHYQADDMLAQSRRALKHLPAGNLPTRASAHWTLGYGHLLQGNRASARAAFEQAITLSQTAQTVFTTILATIESRDLHAASACARHRQRPPPQNL